MSKLQKHPKLECPYFLNFTNSFHALNLKYKTQYFQTKI